MIARPGRSIIATVAVCALAACSGSSTAKKDNASIATATNDSGTTTAPTSTETASSLPRAGEGVGPGDFILPDPKVGLSSLSSYKSSLTVSFEGASGAGSRQWSATSKMLRSVDRAASQWTTANSGDRPPANPSYVAETGGTTYSVDQTGACTAAASSPGSSKLTLLEPATELPGVMGAEPLGEKDIGGVHAVGYKFDERAVGQAAAVDTTGEIWIASDGGHVLEFAMTSKGADELFGKGLSGTITWHYQLTDINQPIAVELPQGCPAGLINAPMPADAAKVLEAPGLLSYETASSAADVLAFYKQASGALGWIPAGEASGDTGGSAEYTSGGNHLVSIIISAVDSGTRVNIVVGDQPAGGGGGGGGVAAQGQATFELTGAHAASGTWVFVPQFSFFGGGMWTLTFDDPANPMPAGPFLTLALTPGNENLSFSDGTATILAGADVCTFTIDHQDAGGAAGTVNCTGARAMSSGGAININITFAVTP